MGIYLPYHCFSCLFRKLAKPRVVNRVEQISGNCVKDHRCLASTKKRKDTRNGCLFCLAVASERVTSRIFCTSCKKYQVLSAHSAIGGVQNSRPIKPGFDSRRLRNAHGSSSSLRHGYAVPPPSRREALSPHYYYSCHSPQLVLQ